MKKNIIIGVLAVLCVAFFSWGLTQRTAAEQQVILAQKQTQLAEEFHKLAEQQELIAVASQKEAENQRALALQALVECEKKGNRK